MCTVLLDIITMRTLTSQFHHNYSPPNGPPPSNETEEDCERLAKTYYHVDEEDSKSWFGAIVLGKSGLANA